MLLLDVGLGESFGALWPILLAMSGGYATLLGIIYKMVQERNTDYREDIKTLREENEKLRETVRQVNVPLAALADSGRDTNRALERALDTMFPPDPRRRE